MHDANEMQCLIFENAIKNILLGKVTKSGVSDANNKLIITIFQMWGHIDPIRSGIGLKLACTVITSVLVNRLHLNIQLSLINRLCKLHHTKIMQVFPTL